MLCPLLNYGPLSGAVPTRWIRRPSVYTKRKRRSFSQEVIGPYHGSPHMGNGRPVESKPFGRLGEVAPDDVFELIEVRPGLAIKRVHVVDSDQARGHIPAVLACLLILEPDEVWWGVVGTEIINICLGIRIADR